LHKSIIVTRLYSYSTASLGSTEKGKTSPQ
jgi:hypothetical protein